MGTGATFTGRLEFELGNGQWSLATVDVSIRLDVIILNVGQRNLAVIDRERFARWLAHPWTPLDVDDLTFLMLDSDLCVSVDGSTPMVVDSTVAKQLVTHV